MYVRFGQNRRAETVDLVAEKQQNGESRSPFENVNGLRRGFHRGCLPTLDAILADEGYQIRAVFPSEAVFGAEGRLSDAFVGRPARIPAQMQTLDARGVSAAEKRADVVDAANGVQCRRYGQP